MVEYHQVPPSPATTSVSGRQHAAGVVRGQGGAWDLYLLYGNLAPSRSARRPKSPPCTRSEAEHWDVERPQVLKISVEGTRPATCGKKERQCRPQPPLCKREAEQPGWMGKRILYLSSPLWWLNQIPPATWQANWSKRQQCRVVIFSELYSYHFSSRQLQTIRQ